MSAVRWLREFGALGLSLFGSVIGWLILAPIAAVVPKRRDWVAVIGRQHGKFLDNAKYFFLQAKANAPDLRSVFITERTDVIELLTPSAHEALRYPGARAIWFLMRCSVAATDSTDWSRHLRRFLLVRAHVVQLWHGVGFKRIELDKWRHETGRYRWFSTPWVFSLRLLFYRITGRLVRYDAVNTTSTFYRDEVFAPAFLSRHHLMAGYPRNTFASSPNDDPEASWANVEPVIAAHMDEWKRQGRRVVVVAPTMRDSGSTPMGMDNPAIQSIDAFADANNVEFIVKFHPSEKGTSWITGAHVHQCSPDSDLYPVLGQAAALVTDYSSIYVDFLLVDRPVLFLIPDGNRYMREDREVQFDLADMMPGPFVDTWQALLAALARQWQTDDFRAERARLRTKAFDDLPQEQATPKLISFMRGEGWLS